VRGRVECKNVLVGSMVYLVGAAVFVPESQRAQRNGSDAFVAAAGKYLGRIPVEDVLRPGAEQAIESLHPMKMRTHRFTGDDPGIAEGDRRRAGVAEIQGRPVAGRRAAAGVGPAGLGQRLLPWSETG